MKNKLDQSIAKPKFYRLGDGLAHYPEFWFEHPKSFKGQKIVTLCKKVSSEFFAINVHGYTVCASCDQKLKKLGGHVASVVKIS